MMDRMRRVEHDCNGVLMETHDGYRCNPCYAWYSRSDVKRFISLRIDDRNIKIEQILQ